MEANGSISSPIDNVIFGVVAEEDINAANGNKIHKGDIVSILDKQKISQYKAHFMNKDLLIPAKYSIKELKTDKGYILLKDKINVVCIVEYPAGITSAVSDLDHGKLYSRSLDLLPVPLSADSFHALEVYFLIRLQSGIQYLFQLP